jgi:hypothetical protein
MAAYDQVGSTYKPFYKDKKFTINLYYTNKGAVSKPRTRSVQDGPSTSRGRETSKNQTNSYMKFYQGNCQSINAMSFSEVKKDALQMLKDPNCPIEIKIMLGDWLFRKVSRCFHMAEDVLETTCGDLAPPIDKCQNTIIKGEYLQFTNIDAINKIALHFYLNRFTNKDKFFILQMLNDTQLVKNYVQDARITDDGMRLHFIDWLKKSSIFEQQSNLLDVLLKYYGSDPEVAQVYNKMRWGKNKERGTLYEDEQNVHDEEVRQSSLDAAEKLMEWDSVDSIVAPPGVKFRDFITGMLYPFYSNEEKPIIDCVVERMCIDHTYFGDGFTIAELFLALLNYIRKSKHKKELLKRLMEEMDSMKELCASGYIVRLINVLQGFDDEYTVSISFDKQLYAVISKALADSLEHASDKIIEGSIEMNDDYLSHVRNVVQDNLPRLFDDYGNDVSVHLVEVLESITMYKGWKYERGTLTY